MLEGEQEPFFPAFFLAFFSRNLVQLGHQSSWLPVESSVSFNESEQDNHSKSGCLKCKLERSAAHLSIRKELFMPVPFRQAGCFGGAKSLSPLYWRNPLKIAQLAQSSPGSNVAALRGRHLIPLLQTSVSCMAKPLPQRKGSLGRCCRSTAGVHIPGLHPALQAQR